MALHRYKSGYDREQDRLILHTRERRYQTAFRYLRDHEAECPTCQRGVVATCREGSAALRRFQNGVRNYLDFVETLRREAR